MELIELLLIGESVGRGILVEGRGAAAGTRPSAAPGGVGGVGYGFKLAFLCGHFLLQKTYTFTSGTTVPIRSDKVSKQTFKSKKEYCSINAKISVVDPDPGWIKNQVTDPGSRMNNSDNTSENLETIFWVKILKFFDADSGWKKSGSGMEKNSDQGSGINNPYPQQYKQKGRDFFSRF
jgi:hypothetical protein